MPPDIRKYLAMHHVQLHANAYRKKASLKRSITTDVVNRDDQLNEECYGNIFLFPRSNLSLRMKALYVGPSV